jgi:hypothetical protein
VSRQKDFASVAVVADGSMAGSYLFTHDKGVSKAMDSVHVHATDGGECMELKGAKAQGNVSTRVVIDWLLRERFLVRGDLLLLDRHQSFLSVDVQEMLDDAGVAMLYYPPGWGSLLDTCDNNIIAWIKRDYFRRLALAPKITPEVKVRAWYDAYNAVAEQHIVRCFHMVGILGNKDPRVVVDELSSATFHAIERFQSMHNEQLAAFERWDKAVRYMHRNAEVPDGPEVGIGDVALDGVHWNRWVWQSAAST